MKSNAENFARQLLRWYDRARRDLPWRAHRRSRSGPNPYHALVSEMMLQQTQVCTVVPYFERFIERFPTISALAASKEQEVLRLWQGLGYYRRARFLHQAAKEVMARHQGKLPRTVHELLILPGIGRYTAGAIASIAFGERAPILDGNVARVLCRLDRIESDARHAATIKQLWKRAEQILPRRRCGDFNSAMMELGATICTPRQPSCEHCPVRRHCVSRNAGVQDRIPVTRASRPIKLLRRDVLCLERADGRYLIEQRPPTGRWAGMWQFITVASGPRETLSNRAGLDGVAVDELKRIGLIQHALSHRRYEFRVYRARIDLHKVKKGVMNAWRMPEFERKHGRDGQAMNFSEAPIVKSTRVWVSLRNLKQYPLPRVHERLARSLENVA